MLRQHLFHKIAGALTDEQQQSSEAQLIFYHIDFVMLTMLMLIIYFISVRFLSSINLLSPNLPSFTIALLRQIIICKCISGLGYSLLLCCFTVSIQESNTYKRTKVVMFGLRLLSEGSRTSHARVVIQEELRWTKLRPRFVVTDWRTILRML